MRSRSLTLAGIVLSFAGTAAAGGRLPPSPPGITAPLSYACVCLTADNAQVAGVTRQLPHTGPYSPYLRPHTTGTAPAAPPTGR